MVISILQEDVTLSGMKRGKKAKSWLSILLVIAGGALVYASVASSGRESSPPAANGSQWIKSLAELPADVRRTLLKHFDRSNIYGAVLPGYQMAESEIITDRTENFAVSCIQMPGESRILFLWAEPTEEGWIVHYKQGGDIPLHASIKLRAAADGTFHMSAPKRELWSNN